MLIGLTGPLCSGKSTLANYLVQVHSYGLLRLHPATPPHISYVIGYEHSFTTAHDLLEFVMRDMNWRKNWVVEGIEKVEEVKVFKKRPWFLLIAVESPILLRYNRYVDRLTNHHLPIPTLETFLTQHDSSLFGAHGSRLSQVMGLADIHIVNNLNSKDEFVFAVQKMDLVNGERVRPSWDTYFTYLCYLAAKRSNCMKRSVGCILAKNNRVLATGYNGTPSAVPNCNMGGCPRCNSNASCGVGLDTCLCIHAEENALLEAGRERITGGNVVLYCSTCPCLGCAKKIVQVGISEVVYAEGYAMDSMTNDLFKTAGVKLRQHKHVGLGVEVLVASEFVSSGEGVDVKNVEVNEKSKSEDSVNLELENVEKKVNLLLVSN